MTTYTDTSPEDAVDLGFPSFVDLGGPAILSSVLLNSQSGLALVSGKRNSGKSTTLASLVNELARSGRRVLAVRTPDAAVIPGVSELFVNSISNTLEQDLLLGDKWDVIVVDEVRTPEAASFVAKLVAAGILVVISIYATDPTRALWEFLNLCKSRRNKLVSRELLFSYGTEIYQSYGKDTPDASVIAAVAHSVQLMGKEGRSNRGLLDGMKSYRDVIVSDYIFPDAVTRNHILGFTKNYLED